MGKGILAKICDSHPDLSIIPNLNPKFAIFIQILRWPLRGLSEALLQYMRLFTVLSVTWRYGYGHRTRTTESYGCNTGTSPSAICLELAAVWYKKSSILSSISGHSPFITPWTFAYHQISNRWLPRWQGYANAAMKLPPSMMLITQTTLTNGIY